MNETQTEAERVVEFRLSKKKFIFNLLKLIPTMRRIRKRAEQILLETEPSELKVEVPNSGQIQKDLETICKVPHRRIGTEYAHEIEDFLVNKCKELGLESVQKEPVDVINWSAKDWKLTITTENEEVEISSFYMLNSGFTAEDGITAPLVYVETGQEKDFKHKDVRNKIVVADIECPSLPLGKLMKLTKQGNISINGNQKSSFRLKHYH